MQDIWNIVLAIAVGSAVAVAVSALTATASLAAVSSVTASSFTAYAWQKLRSVIGLLPARKKTWGTVYDAVTKRPVPYAKILLIGENERVLEARVADGEGRYGFLATPASMKSRSTTVRLAVSVPGYSFPATAPVTIDTFVYGNLYYGDRIPVSDEMLVNFDIPVQPAKPQHGTLLATSPSVALGAMTAAVADTGFWLGIVLVPMSFIVSPNPFTLGILFVFLGTASLRLFGIRERPFGTVADATTGRAMPFALITLNDAEGTRVAFAVSDERGRYFMAVPKGTYRLNAVTPGAVVPMRNTERTLTLRKGWVTLPLRF